MAVWDCPWLVVWLVNLWCSPYLTLWLAWGGGGGLPFEWVHCSLYWFVIGIGWLALCLNITFKKTQLLPLVRTMCTLTAKELAQLVFKPNLWKLSFSSSYQHTSFSTHSCIAQQSRWGGLPHSRLLIGFSSPTRSHSMSYHSYLLLSYPPTKKKWYLPPYLPCLTTGVDCYTQYCAWKIVATLARWSTVSCALALACRPFVSKK